MSWELEKDLSPAQLNAYAENRHSALISYGQISDQIATARSNLVTSLATLHEDVCTLAQLERNLQANYEIIAPSANSSAEVLAAINQHSQLVQLPASKVWASIDGAMQLIGVQNALGVSPVAGAIPEVFRRDRFPDFTGTLGTVESPESALANYIDLSGQIATARANLITSLATLHDDLCALAQLERNLQVQANIILPDVDHYDIRGAVQEHLQLVQLPALQVWSNIDTAMQLISTHNGLGVSPAAGEVPAVFRRSDRILDFTGQA